MKALITKKLGMTSIINDDGSVVAVTLLSMEPNVVTQIKSTETDGYNAVQIGAWATKKVAKPQAGHYKKANFLPRIVREMIISEDEAKELTIGDKISADSFSLGDIVHVTSNSKGKGFAGTIKRHGFHRGRKTHGGGSYRRPGSIGSMYPQKVFKGKKMAGRMGNDQVTVRNLKVALIDQAEGVIGVAGAVPGPRKGTVIVRGKGIMVVTAFTSTGNKSTSTPKLDKTVFNVELKNHHLLKAAYVAYLANGRTNNAKTKTRADVSGGGKKPWRQKGTGRARFGSTRNPIWRGGGVAFADWVENYTHKLHKNAKQQAIRQSLSLATQDKKLIIIDDFKTANQKTREAKKLLTKIGAIKNTLLVVASKTEEQERAVSNLSNVKLVQANYLNVFDCLNADHIVMTTEALSIVNTWLGVKND